MPLKRNFLSPATSHLRGATAAALDAFVRSTEVGGGVDVHEAGVFEAASATGRMARMEPGGGISKVAFLNK